MNDPEYRIALDPPILVGSAETADRTRRCRKVVNTTMEKMITIQAETLRKLINQVVDYKLEQLEKIWKSEREAGLWQPEREVKIEADDEPWLKQVKAHIQQIDELLEQVTLERLEDEAGANGRYPDEE